MTGASAVWLDAFWAGAGQVRLNEIFGLDSAAKRLALIEIGCTVAQVAPRGGYWLEPEDGEPVIEAVLVPVGVPDVLDRVVPLPCSSTLRINPADAAAHCDSVADVIAIPVNGSPALSYSGYTAAIGTFAVRDGKCRLVCSGLTFLRRYLDRVLSGDDALPCVTDTLILDREAFEWRISENPAIVPRHDQQLACVDSTELAAWLVQAMRKRAPSRKPPEVLAPKSEREAV
jgi:hypothetical protein